MSERHPEFEEVPEFDRDANLRAIAPTLAYYLDGVAWSLRQPFKDREEMIEHIADQLTTLAERLRGIQQ